MRAFLGVLGLGLLAAAGCGSEIASGDAALASDGTAAAAKPWQGKQRALVLLLKWSNVDSVVTRDQVESTFFAAGAGATSVRQFFLENSVGAFDLTGQVLDWRRTSASWDKNGSCNLRSIADRAWTTFGEGVDISQYDADGDGKIDNLFVVHSGRIAHDRVGPECTFTSHPRADRTVVFQSQGIGSIGDAIAVGFYIHEGGHGYYGLPDLYGDHYHGRYGIGMWGMMGLGAWGTNNAIPRPDMFRVPAHFEPYSKVRMGWIQPHVIRTTQSGVVLRPVEQTGDIVAVPVGSGVNYYLEFRSPRSFSSDHRGHGMLVWKNYALVQADGRDDLNHGSDLGVRPLPPNNENFGDGTDPFPTSTATSFTDAAAGVSFQNIRRYDDRIELDVVVRGAAPEFRVEPALEVFDGTERL